MQNERVSVSRKENIRYPSHRHTFIYILHTGVYLCAFNILSDPNNDLSRNGINGNVRVRARFFLRGGGRGGALVCVVCGFCQFGRIINVSSKNVPMVELLSPLRIVCTLVRIEKERRTRTLNMFIKSANVIYANIICVKCALCYVCLAFFAKALLWHISVQITRLHYSSTFCCASKYKRIRTVHTHRTSHTHAFIVKRFI